MRRVLVIPAMLALGVVLNGVPVFGHTLHVTDDTEANLNKPNENNGNAKNILIKNVGSGGDRHGYFKFDLDSLATDLEGESIAKATLRIYVHTVNTPGDLSVHRVIDSWDEENFTAGQGVSIDPTVLASGTVTLNENKSIVTFEVTQVVKDWLEHVYDNNWLAVLPSNTDNVNITLSSKEKLDLTLPAELEVAYETHREDITTNTADIGINSDNIATNTSDIGTNAGNINTNTTNIAANSTAIASLQAEALEGFTFFDNTSVGYNSFNKTSGFNNTAIGIATLQDNASGGENTAAGARALQENVSGTINTAVGSGAQQLNISGSGNTAAGYAAGQLNISGENNTGVGANALQHNAAGSMNTAVGRRTLQNATGSGNSALGYQAGQNLTTGSNNIYLNNIGASNDSGTIRIGTNGSQITAFIAGVRGVTTGAADAIGVMIDSNGQLGTLSSSRRYKEGIQDMGSASHKLLALRPVTYRYRQASADGTKPMQYGLIAEEVAEVYPDLVVYDNEGQVQTVQYHKLVPMLLNELQKDRKLIDQQSKRMTEIKAQLEVVEAQNRQLKEIMARLANLERLADNQWDEILQTRYQP